MSKALRLHRLSCPCSLTNGLVSLDGHNTDVRSCSFTPAYPCGTRMRHSGGENDVVVGW